MSTDFVFGILNLSVSMSSRKV